jgi:molybdopterin adenylyltransferase
MQINVGIITISDRASRGQYDDPGGPALKKVAAGCGWKVALETPVTDELLNRK